MEMVVGLFKKWFLIEESMGLVTGWLKRLSDISFKLT